MKTIKICPTCGKTYNAVPAISRKDNTTEICPECGIKEALQRFDFTADEIKQIISITHNKA